MKITDLRICNYVDYNGNSKNYEILISDFSDIHEDANDFNYYKPYPLTENWLLNFGFIRKELKDVIYYEKEGHPNFVICDFKNGDGLIKSIFR